LIFQQPSPAEASECFHSSSHTYINSSGDLFIQLTNMASA
jgi:hypothetical protein